MNYELADKLCDADFPKQAFWTDPHTQYIWHAPTLSEIIEACVKLSETGDFHLERNEDGTWGASVDCFKGDDYIEGGTPEIAVAKLWLAIHSQPVDQQTD